MLLAVAPIVSTPATATVQLDDLAGILVVKTMVNGKGPYHFVLDTGAGITVVTPEFAKALHLRASGDETAHGTGEQAVAVKTTTLETVSVGSATQRQVPAAIIPLPIDLTYQGAYGTIDGIVGFTFLQKYAVSIDIANARASLTLNADFKPPGDTVAIPLTFAEQRIPVMTASVEGAAGQFEIDSGNNGDITLTQSFANAHNIASKYPAPIRSQYEGVGGRVNATRVRVKSFTLGQLAVHDVAANISQAKGGALLQDRLDGTFGYDVLRQFVMTLDYRGSRLYLQPGAAFGTSKTFAGTGIVRERNADGTFNVIGVIDATPAARAGIKTGDTILAVNGKSSALMNEGEYQAIAGENVGASVTYTLRSNDGERTVTMTTIDLLPPIGQ